MVEEARALINADFLMALESQESAVSVRLQNLRLKWERGLQRPLKSLKPQNERPTAKKP